MTGQAPRRRETDAQAERRAAIIQEREAARVRLAEERVAALTQLELQRKAGRPGTTDDAYVDAYRRAVEATRAFNRGIAA